MTDEPIESHEPQEVKRRKGIYLLPNLFTTACLFAGFYAIVAAMNGRYEAAAVAIFIAMIMDGLDGRVARLTNTQSDFGAQYDSLADMVSFGLAPALVCYVWALSGLGKLGWLAAFVYTAGAALRLARFNVQAAVMDKRYFKGLASPAAAALIAGMVWLATDNEVDGDDVVYGAFILTVGAGLLMVSSILYRSFKDIDLKGKVPFVKIFVVVMIFVAIAANPPLVLFTVVFCYTLSGPITALLRRERRDKQMDQDPPPPE